MQWREMALLKIWNFKKRKMSLVSDIFGKIFKTREAHNS